MGVYISALVRISAQGDPSRQRGYPDAFQEPTSIVRKDPRMAQTLKEKLLETPLTAKTAAENMSRLVTARGEMAPLVAPATTTACVCVPRPRAASERQRAHSRRTCDGCALHAHATRVRGECACVHEELRLRPRDVVSVGITAGFAGRLLFHVTSRQSAALLPCVHTYLPQPCVAGR